MQGAGSRGAPAGHAPRAVARAVGRHPRGASGLSAAGLLVCAASFTTSEVDGTTQAETFLTIVGSVTGQEVLDEHVPPGTEDTSMVIGPADEADQTLQVVQGTDGITGASAGVADARCAATIGVGAVVSRYVFDLPGSDPAVPLFALVLLVALGVLLETIAVRSLLLPGLAYDLGRRTWRPSRPSREPISGSPARAPAQNSEVVSTS